MLRRLLGARGSFVGTSQGAAPEIGCGMGATRQAFLDIDLEFAYAAPPGPAPAPAAAPAPARARA